MVLEENGNTHEELINLQNSCRNVSKAFKEEVEGIFVARHLPQTSIWLAQGGKGNLEVVTYTKMILTDCKIVVCTEEESMIIP